MSFNASFLGPRWSIRAGHIAGTEIRLHASFVLLFLWIAVDHYRGGLDASAPFIAMAFAAAVLMSILIHELGHAIAARRFGVPTRRIMLYPVGGVAELEHAPRTFAHELVIALAGPAVNLGLGASLATLLFLDEGLASHRAANAVGPFLAKLMWVNLGLGLFNLLPAFPLDGGRALRAFLSAGTGFVTGTLTAVKVAKAIAGLLLAGALFGEPVLALVAAVVWIGAEEEAAYARSADFLTLRSRTGSC